MRSRMHSDQRQSSLGPGVGCLIDCPLLPCFAFWLTVLTGLFGFWLYPLLPLGSRIGQ